MYRAISVTDLRKLDSWRDDFLLPENKQLLDTILWKHGVDVHKPYTIDWCLHRNLFNEAIYGQRINGYERTDKTWLRSGYASVEAHIYSTDDISLQQELRNMNRTSESFSEHTITIDLEEEIGEE